MYARHVEHACCSSFGNGCIADSKQARAVQSCHTVALQEEPGIYASLHLVGRAEGVCNAVLLIFLQAPTGCLIAHKLKLRLCLKVLFQARQAQGTILQQRNHGVSY